MKKINQNTRYRADGMAANSAENVTTKSMGFSLSSTATIAITICMFGGYLENPVLDPNTGTLLKSGKQQLTTAGFGCDQLLTTKTVTGLTKGEGVTGSLVMQSTNPKRTIESYKGYLDKNPLFIKGIYITSDDPSIFNSVISYGFINPFGTSGLEEINLQKHFDRYQQQNSKIYVPFPRSGVGAVEVSDILYMDISIPSSDGTNALSCVVDIDFYEPTY